MKEIATLRRAAHMTQQAFAKRFGIPVSTLRKWEQGETSPPAYVIRLIARSLPVEDSTLRKITGKNGEVYYYSESRHSFLDDKGNEIRFQEELDGVKEHNLPVYLADLFEDFYAIQGRFNRDCYYDKQEDILWSRE